MAPQKSSIIQLFTHAALVMVAAAGGADWESAAEGQLVDPEKKAEFLQKASDKKL